MLRNFLVSAMFFLISSSADAGCLELDRASDITDYFYNKCYFVVGVKWNSDLCPNWSCLDYIGPGRHQAINKAQTDIEWMECRGEACTPKCEDAHDC